MKRKNGKAVDVPMALLLREIALYAREHALTRIYCKELGKRNDFLSAVLADNLRPTADDVGILALDKVVKEVRGALAREGAYKRLQRLEWLAEQVRRALF